MIKNSLLSAVMTAFILFIPTLNAASAVPEVVLRHLSTTFVNHGICSIRFGISSELTGGDAGDVKIHVNFVNPAGDILHRDVITTHLEDTTAGRYQEEFVEGEDLCFPEGTQVVITQASVTIGTEVYDLVELGRIREESFRPYRISVDPTASVQAADTL